MESKAIVMLIRLRLILLSLGSGLTLLLVLCLGAQNLNDRHRSNFGVGSSAPLPSGFIVCVSLVLGIIIGLCVAAVLAPAPDQDR